MKSKSKGFKGYTRLTDDFYIKLADSSCGRYDLYKCVTTEKHPDGKLKDWAYGVSLLRAIEIVVDETVGAHELSTLKAMQAAYEKNFKEIKEIIKSLN